MELLSKNRKKEIVEAEISAIKQAVVASIILEESTLQIIDSTKNELKRRCNYLLKAARSVQNYFMLHENVTTEYSKIFRQEFLGGNIVLYGEILSTIHGLTEESLEHVLHSLQDYVASASEDVVEESGETLKS